MDQKPGDIVLLMEQVKNAEINDANKRKLVKKYCKVYKALTNLKECARYERNAATGDSNEHKNKSNTSKRNTHKKSKHRKPPEEAPASQSAPKEESVKEMPNKLAKATKSANKRKGISAKKLLSTSSSDNASKSSTFKATTKLSQEKHASSEGDAVKKKKKKKARRRVECKETQVDALNGNPRAVSSASKVKHEYATSSTILKEVRMNAATCIEDGVKVITKLRRVPVTLSASKKNITSARKKSKKKPKSANLPMNRPLSLDTIDTIEEIVLNSDEQEEYTEKDELKKEAGDSLPQGYSQAGQQALSILSDEVSAALRDSFCSIDDIQMRIRHTINEINECDKMYQKLKSQSQAKTPPQSQPQLPKLENSISKVEVGPEQINVCCGEPQQPENVETTPEVPPADNTENISTRPISRPASAPMRASGVATLPFIDSVQWNEPILPKLIPIVANANQPCTMLTQQKKYFNIPPTLNDAEASDKFLSKPRCRLQKTLPKTFSAQGAKKVLRDIRYISTLAQNVPMLRAEIGQPLLDNMVPPAVDELPRIRAQSNLHTQLVQEVKATDSLLEFQKHMKAKSKKKKGKTAEFVAEELFIPERKINRIGSATLNPYKSSEPLTKAKATQYLYREKHKAKDQPQALKKHRTRKGSVHDMQEKYPGSLLFSGRSKKAIRNNSVVAHAASSITFNASAMSHRHVSTHASVIIDEASLKGDSLRDDDDLSTIATDTQSVQFKTGLDCFDILDEITLNDLKPFEPEYPRKDHLGSKPFYTPVEDSYLYKLMYGNYKNQFTKLLRYEIPMLNCRTPNCPKCNVCEQYSNDIQNGSPVLQGSSEKDVHGKRERLVSNTTHGRDRKRALSSTSSNESWSNILGKSDYHTRGSFFNPRHGSITSSMYASAHFRRAMHAKSGKKIKKVNDEDVAKKLRPYIFDPHMRYPTTITVMPVIVTTYANPHFTQSKKNQSGDFSSSTVTKLTSKSDPKEKLPITSQKSQVKQQISSNKLWNYKYPKTASSKLINYLEKQNVRAGQTAQRFGDAWEASLDQKDTVLRTKRKRSFYSPKESTPIVDATSVPQPQSQAPSPTKPKVVITSSLHSPRIPSPPKVTTRKPISPRSLLHKHAAESRKLLKDIQKLSQKTKLENSIQNVIDMIESKIVEILSSPEKSHSEAFKTVESKIVEILETLKTHDPSQLEAIQEVSDTTTECFKKQVKAKLKKKFSAQSGNSLLKSNELRVEDKGTKTDTPPTKSKTTTSLMPEVTEVKNDECFLLTAVCVPKQGEVAKEGKEMIKDPAKPAVAPKDQEDKGKGTKKTRTALKKSPASQIIPEKKMANKPIMSNVEKKDATSQAGTLDEVLQIPCNKKFTPNLLNIATIEVGAETENAMLQELVAIRSSETLMFTASSVTQSDSSVEEVPVVRSVPAVVEIKPDTFLTPFMSALKQYRQEDHRNSASSILEFLDTLANISNSSTVLNKHKLKTIHYKYTVRLAHILYQPTIFYPITIHYPATITPRLKVLFESDSVHGHYATKYGERDPKSVTWANQDLSKFLVSGDSLQTSATNEVICCRVDKVVPQNRRVRPSLAKFQPKPLSKCLSARSETSSKMDALGNDVGTIYGTNSTPNGAPVVDHGAILNSIYGLLFTTVFFGLTFNYSCQ